MDLHESCQEERKEGEMMLKQLTQEERLDYLVEEFKADSEEYRDIETPKDTEGKKKIWRGILSGRN